ncbi:hypothetical protein [Paenibacillus harenae]|uniref:DUF5050 domain-containing protein n=1 Tax=Paenibacillus harenae TaxID=306543 RepID=A0ABT9U2V2_PAEHA|nr:hypothetical protein [Paenibacillus harenae]MDQ0113955.1 hypothetical protein [Paenibacillus harenae]
MNEGVAIMKLRRRRIIWTVCIVIPMLTIILYFYWSADAKREAVIPAATRLVSTQPIADAAPDWTPPAEPFDADTAEPLVLWKKEQNSIYVQDSHLYYSSDGVDERVLYTWEQSLTTQAWVSGNALLIGTQLIDSSLEQEGHRGAWISVQTQPTPAITELDNIYFGPQQVLAVTAANEPSIFLIMVRNGISNFSEYIVAPSHKEWIPNNSQITFTPNPKEPGTDNQLRYFTNVHTFPLPEGSAIYSFADEYSSLLYFQSAYPYVLRYADYSLTDVKQVFSPKEHANRLIGRFSNEAGDEALSYLDLSFAYMPYEPRLWEGEWQALNNSTFTRATPEQIEVIQYKEDAPFDTNTPTYDYFPTTEGRLITTKGMLAEYDVRGMTQYISLYDFVNTEEASPRHLWSSPLKEFAIKKEERPAYIPPYFSYEIPDWSYQDFNTNESIPEELLGALEEVRREGDYGYAKVFRKYGSQWFVLYDRYFYEYTDGQLSELGELPVTVKVSIGEAAGGRGAMDFIRWRDAWFIADTEGSRVIKLNDKLEVEAEFAVHTPYRLTSDGDQLRIASIAGQLTVDAQFKLLNTKQLPFESTARMKKAMFDGFMPHQLYDDTTSGLTWYYFDGSLYQYDAKKQQYRSFYVGFTVNARASEKIIPYRDEVVLLLDHRLERFDRQGNWLSTLAYPRSTPDGIYDMTTQGESSLIVDETSELYYLVQGYRILAIDLARNEVNTVFRQNYADIGPLLRHGDSIYFMLHSDLEERYRQLMQQEETNRPLYTEIVKIDMQTKTVSRAVIDGYYDAFDIEGNAGDEPAFVLRSYFN